jgi:hypothetical protein
MDHAVIFCAWCQDHRFKVDPPTVRDAGIVELQCPRCAKVTSLSVRPDGTIYVLPGPPPAPGSRTGDSKEAAMVALAKQAEEAFSKNDFDKALAALKKLQETDG